MSAAAQPAELLRHLEVAAAAYADRLRRRPVGWWAAESGRPGRSRADLVAELIAAYAGWEQSITGRGGRAVPARPDRDDVLADQYAVVARELLTALAAEPPGAVAEALAETLRNRQYLDGAAPDPAAVEALRGR